AKKKPRHEARRAEETAAEEKKVSEEPGMPGFTRDDLQSYAREKRGEFESVLKKIVEIPSVSVDPHHKPDVHRAGEYAVQLLESFGGKAQLFGTKGHPIVHGRFDRGPSYPTVTIY